MLSLSPQYQQRSDMFFTNGVLGYIGQTSNIIYSQVLWRHEDQTDSSSFSPTRRSAPTMSIGRTEAPPGVLLQLFHQPQNVRMAPFSVLYVLRKQPQNWAIANNQLKNGKQTLIYKEL